MSEKMEPRAVTQADREAAADQFHYLGHNMQSMRDGLMDSNGTVQAFARHRLAHSTPANGEQVERVGWRVVPLDLTQEMLDATCATDQDDAAMRAAWPELLRTAPKPPTPTQDARERVKVLEEALGRAKHKLGHVTVDGMNGDNLAVTLCSHFDDGEGDEDEHGWTEAATAGCDATLKAIHAMYADVLRTALGNQEERL